MDRLFLAVALGAASVSMRAGAEGAPAAQGGAVQQDMSRQQAQQYADALFARLDINHDGTVTRAEADQVHAQMGGRGHLIERSFGAAKSLSLAQFEAATLALFDADDTNHDGIIVAAERDHAHALRAQKQGQ